jgi:hypothetical protein
VHGRRAQACQKAIATSLIQSWYYLIAIAIFCNEVKSIARQEDAQGFGYAVREMEEDPSESPRRVRPQIRSDITASVRRRVSS